MKAVDIVIDTISWEGLAADRTKWRSALKQHLKTGEEKLMAASRQTSKKKGSRAVASSDPKPYIDVISAIKTAIPTLVFSAISDAATTHQKFNKIKNKKQKL